MMNKSHNMNLGMILTRKNLKLNKRRKNRISNMRWSKYSKSQYSTKKNQRKDWRHQL